MLDYQSFRAEKDRFLLESSQSPLLSEQKQNFSRLSYFPEAPELRLEVQVERVDHQGEVHIPTSTGGMQVYTRYGKFRFLVDGQHAELTIFSSPHGYFLPFVDNLAGQETYPAGRYLEPESLGDDRFLVDFNLAYNPYCAYNDRWSCPLTPPENRIRVPVRAGEKIFPH